MMVTNLKLHTQQDNRISKRLKLVEIIILALLGAIMYVSQVIMAPLPNIEIVSLLIILTTRRFGYKALLSVYIFAGCEIFTYGIGIWQINYLYVWAILWLIVFLLKKSDSVILFTLVSAIFGLLFGTLCSVPYFVIGGIEMGVANIISGISFDLLHCGGNALACILLYKPMTKLFEKLFKPFK